MPALQPGPDRYPGGAPPGPAYPARTGHAPLLAGVKHWRGSPQQEIYTSPKAIRNTKCPRNTLAIPSQYPAQVSHIPAGGLGNTLRGFRDCGGLRYGEAFTLAGVAVSLLPSLRHVPQ